MADVAFRNASRIFAGTPEVRAVDSLDLDVADGEFLVLVGPSGSGKSTMTLTTVPLTAAGLTLGPLTVPVARSTLDDPAVAGLTEIQVGIRPESLEVISSVGNGIEVTVELVEELGADAYVYGTASLAAPTRLVVRVDGRNPPTVGRTISVGLRRPDELHLFHPSTGERIHS